MNAQVELVLEDKEIYNSENALEQLSFVEVLVENYQKRKIKLAETVLMLKQLDSTSKHLMEVLGAEFKPAINLEKLEHLLKVESWNTVFVRSNIVNYLDADKRAEWKSKLYVNKDNVADLPEFTLDNVTETIKGWYADRENMFMDRVDLVFRSLSKKHVTNQPEGFSKKLIFTNGCESNWSNDYNITWQTDEKLYDLECLICMLTNRPLPERSNTYRRQSLSLGMKHSFLGDSYQLQVFKSGTIHIWIQPSIALELNIWLAKKYPSAIPSQHRVKSETFKEYTYHYDCLSSCDVKFLERIISGYGTWDCHKDVIQRFVYFTGCTAEDINKPSREIDLNLIKLARLVLRNGYPNVKDHQFYPTPKTITEDVAEYLGDRVENTDLKILEPSAGTGKLAQLFTKYQVTCVEVNSFFAESLQYLGFSNVHNTDFMKFKSDEKFDIIAMNPPYSEKRLENHLEKALTLLADEGELILIAPTGKKSKIEVIAQGYTVEEVKKHVNEFEETAISTSIFSITK